MNQTNRSGDISVAERMAGKESLPILTAKLYRPLVAPDLEQRIRLMERLKHNPLRPLALVSAPAAYDKAKVARMWLEACDCPSAWLSLYETDNEPGSCTTGRTGAASRNRR